MTQMTNDQPNEYQLIQMGLHSSLSIELELSPSNIDPSSPIVVTVGYEGTDFDLRIAPDEAIELAHALLTKAMQSKAAGLD